MRLSRGLEERKEILQMLNDGGYSVVDLSDDEMAKLHVRYMVGGHEAMVSMVALGCGVALLPEVVLENSPEPVRNRVMLLERSDAKTPFELGVCAQKKRLHEPLIEAFWKILPNH